jgi:hypothetical protein
MLTHLSGVRPYCCTGYLLRLRRAELREGLKTLPYKTVAGDFAARLVSNYFLVALLSKTVLHAPPSGCISSLDVYDVGDNCLTT